MGRRASGAESAPAFSFKLIGLGFWQAWWMLVLCSPLVLPVSPPFNLIVRPNFWALACTSVGFIVLALWGRCGKPFIKGRGFMVLAAGLCAGGTVVCATTQTITDPVAFGVVFFASVGASAFGSALLLVMWAELWATLATSRVSQYLFTSYAFAFVLFFAVKNLFFVVAVAITAMFPVVGCVILRASISEPRRRAPTATFAIDRSLLAKAAVAVAFCGFAYGLVQSLFANLVVSPAPAWRPDFMVAGACMFALTLGVFISRPIAGVGSLYRPIIPALSIGFVLAATMPTESSFLGNGLAILGGYCLDMIIMLASTDLAFRMRRPVAPFFCVAVLMLRVSTIAGMAFVDIAIAAGAITQSDLIYGCAAGAVMVILAGTLVFTQEDLQRICLPEPNSQTSIGVDAVCQDLATSFGLSARETEVLLLLARGRNVPYICKDLCIAEGTARHHVGSIYRKLGVYDRQGLMDLVLQS